MTSKRDRSKAETDWTLYRYTQWREPTSVTEATLRAAFERYPNRLSNFIFTWTEELFECRVTRKMRSGELREFGASIAFETAERSAQFKKGTRTLLLSQLITIEQLGSDRWDDLAEERFGKDKP